MSRLHPPTLRRAAVWAAIAVVCALAACGKKGDPIAPEGAVQDDRPQLVVPGLVTDPIQQGRV